MATNKTVTVTVLPTLSGDTAASYNVYEGVSGTTLLGTMSVAEAAAGKVFAFTDGIVHSVKTQTVWTTAGSSSLRSVGVPLDLSAATTYGLEILAANAATVRIPQTINEEDFELSFTPDNAPVNSELIIGNNATVADGSFYIHTYTSQNFYFIIYDGVAKQSPAPSRSWVVGEKITFKREGLTTFNMYFSADLVSTVEVTSGLQIAGSIINLGSKNGASDFVDCTFSQFALKVGAAAEETFLPTTQSTGGTITGSLGTTLTITATDIDACYSAL